MAASPQTFTHDANGNLTTQGTKTYQWDAENRLVWVLNAGTEIARFVYDGGGRRVQKTTSGTTRSYVYDGMDILEERSSSGTIRTVQGPGIDQPPASVDSTGAEARMPTLAKIKRSLTMSDVVGIASLKP